ncbi:hypothetical protein FM106_30210 [Brachybacterium faecium]|nr:hypothetical protein FM106_30210 [Brachybacterium faecium]
MTVSHPLPSSARHLWTAASATGVPPDIHNAPIPAPAPAELS